MSFTRKVKKANANHPRKLQLGTKRKESVAKVLQMNVNRKKVTKKRDSHPEIPDHVICSERVFQKDKSRVYHLNELMNDECFLHICICMPLLLFRSRLNKFGFRQFKNKG